VVCGGYAAKGALTQDCIVVVEVEQGGEGLVKERNNLLYSNFIK